MWLKLKLLLKRILFRTGFKLWAKCGHKTSPYLVSTLNGVLYSATIPISSDGSVPICTKCFKRMVFACGWCGLPIALGDKVTLYEPMPGYVPPPGFLMHGKALVGCFRPTCCDRQPPAVGVWLPLPDFSYGELHVLPTAMDFLQKVLEAQGFTVLRARIDPPIPNSQEVDLLSEIVKPHD